MRGSNAEVEARVSNTDGFVDEVTEELQRDKLFAAFRKYGWIGLVAVVLLVAGASYSEWTRAKTQAEAQARGDAIRAALAAGDPAARASGLADQPGPVAELLRASALIEAGQEAEAAAALTQVSGDPVYTDLARLKRAMLSETPEDEAVAALTELSAPGGPFRLIAMEQLALHALGDGDFEAAATQLRAVLEDAGVTAGQRDRATTLLLALGVEAEG